LLGDDDALEELLGAKASIEELLEEVKSATGPSSESSEEQAARAKMPAASNAEKNLLIITANAHAEGLAQSFNNNIATRIRTIAGVINATSAHFHALFSIIITNITILIRALARAARQRYVAAIEKTICGATEQKRSCQES
jgi:hypothetical protein